MKAQRKVPAWEVQTGGYSHPDYVFIFRNELNTMGWPKTRLVHRLTPMDREEQERLGRIRPEWLGYKDRVCYYCGKSISNDEDAVQSKTKNALAHFTCWYAGEAMEQ